MQRTIHGLMSAGGLVACCAATMQVSQLADGRAAPELWNYALTAATALTGIGLTGAGFFRLPNGSSTTPAQQTESTATDHPALVAALDLLFAHFPDDTTAQEAVRVVARSVTERRYRAVKSEG